jgi:hypothetical protein
LCIAWKYEDSGGSRVCFASDSCVTVLSEEDSLEIPYGGIKVLAIPVRIIPTPTSIPGQLRPVCIHSISPVALVAQRLLRTFVSEFSTEAQRSSLSGLPPSHAQCGLVAQGRSAKSTV